MGTQGASSVLAQSRPLLKGRDNQLHEFDAAKDCLNYTIIISHDLFPISTTGLS